MNNLLFATLYSSSAGNAVYLAYGEEALLFDAGKNAKALEKALAELGESPEKIKAVFVTHEHSDHVSALPVLSRRYHVPIHLPAPCAKNLTEYPLTCVCHPPLFEEQVGPFHIKSFLTPHDSVCSVGYTVEVGGKKFGIATDMGILAKNVVEALNGCTAALIECNYDEEMLKNGPYPYYLKERISGARGHLSNSDGALLAAILAFSGTRHLLLGHLSPENNTEEKALLRVQEEFEKRQVSAHVLVAKRNEPTVLLREES